MIEIILLLACCCFVFMIALGAFFLNMGEEGDECEGKDDNGKYVRDKDLDCVLKSCDTKYYKSGKECLVDKSGVVCVPIGTPDPQGTYLTTQIGGCELISCATGYIKDDDECARDIPSGQYVKVVHTVAYDADVVRVDSAEVGETDKNKVLNLAEVEVFAPGGTTSLAAGMTVTGTNLWSTYPGSYLVDGNMNNFAHTGGVGANVLDEFLVDLGSVQEIEKIKITNRTDCCQERAIGIKAVILGADGTTVIKETPTITTNAATYTFTFPGTAWV